MHDSLSSTRLHGQQPVHKKKSRFTAITVELVSWSAAAIVFFLVFKLMRSLF